MASIDELEDISTKAHRAFFSIQERRQISSGEIEGLAGDYIQNALRLYLSLPTAEPYSSDFISSQYEFFGRRIANITNTHGRTEAVLDDLIEAIRECGIMFVCTPPTTRN